MTESAESITEALFERGEDLDLFDDEAIAEASFACESILRLDRMLRERGERLGDAGPELARSAARRLERAVRARNQYFSFSSAQEAAARAAYIGLLGDIERSAWASEGGMDQLRARVIGHRLRLRSAFEGPVRSAPCFYYGAELQIRLLGIDLSALEGPILDLGCGPKATLVEYLRSEGFEAVGVDRYVRNPSPCLIEADWSCFPLREGSWGAVISHMAFSNHFTRRHLEGDGREIALARKYREILRSLKPGGTFYYAPSLPFIERYVDPGEYAIAIREVAAGFGATAIRRTLL